MRSRASRYSGVTAALLLVVSFAVLPFSPNRILGFGGVLLAEAAAKTRTCAELSDLFNYGVNKFLFDSGGESYFTDGQYFCADTAPAQYRCNCDLSTTCKRSLDPWGRNIGVCGCCPGWMIACLTLICLVFGICIVGILYGMLFQGCWWCDGYEKPTGSLMPRRGPAVTCPSTRPLPDNLFRGYVSTDFTNAAPSPAEENAVLSPAGGSIGRTAEGGESSLSAFSEAAMTSQ
ncbi:putative mitochondrial hypothetical protein [Leptomonas pyrrhocoris]|uniref:Enriched in surface-labeled proteome protein 11 n=1 Tax=Leptomonas pyrrhocoris TaxID=157538 RepID=A0A0M9G4N9_LEPPY|nr:putative mitochondrial hypothetical protein [Leptomonas pyrrhocoris]XP_015660617.1 putative mitochondrial hypothetical protein [Leptomonas pyrrhocoris]KPA82177.1 putative mitochondrial hypothetical protein [Leptomonas pyrrhocoris]KPA82178.1 putative mitochondrial hypothetical protein [Leptomonas pyrrhocoris]|eukprot:XP_015660616.1 putative mitochondrial hypothetical protein [Leptomonas pyrrhocoris]